MGQVHRRAFLRLGLLVGLGFVTGDKMTRRLLIAGGGRSFVGTAAFALTSAPEGGWSWFADPRAVHYAGLTYFGFVNGDGDVIVRSVDPVTRVVSAETVLHAALNVDDHAYPTLLIRDSDHKLLAFYSVHDGPTMRMRISTTSLDTDPDLSDGFAGEVSLDASLSGADYTYPNPIQLLGETNDPVYLYYRDIQPGSTSRYDLTRAISTDGGATWGVGLRLTNITRAYWRVVQTSDTRVDFAVTDKHPFYAAGSLYHFYYDGGYFQSDGTAMGSPPFDESDMTLVYNGASVRSWVWDISSDGGQPIIAFATFPSTSDHRYQYARWTGSAWVVNQVTPAGGHIYGNSSEPYYSGGVVIDRTDPRRLYLSRKVGSQWEVESWSTDDGGATWSSRALTSASSHKQIRPAAVHSPDPRLRVLWMAGDYTTYQDWDTGTSGGR